MARTRRPGEQSRREIERYRALVAEHPRWTNQHIAQFLGVRHQEVTRWRTMSEVEPELLELLFTDQITFAVLDTLISSKPKGIVKPSDKVTIAKKVAAGLVGRGVEPMRELMELMPAMQRHPTIRANWVDPALGWGLQELKVALIDADADVGYRKRETRERHKLLEVEMDVVNFGPRALKFVQDFESWAAAVTRDAEGYLTDLETLREQEPAVMAMPYFTRAVPKEMRAASARLAEVGEKLWEMADEFEARKRPRDPRAAAGEIPDGRTIDG